MPSTQRDVMPPGAVRTPWSVIDVTLGASLAAVALTRAMTRRAAPLVRPASRLALDPPMLPRRLRPARWLVAMESRGAAFRPVLTERATQLVRAAVPVVVEEALRSVDLTRMLTKHVDLDGLVADVDVDAVVRQVDLEAVLDRLDLTRVVLQRVDLEAVVGAVLDRLDLTGVVLQRVDLEAVVGEALAKVDLAALAEDVIAAVDLPEIIRASSGSIASGTVQGARMQGIAADQAVARARGRLRPRRRPSPPADGQPVPALPQARPTGR